MGPIVIGVDGSETAKAAARAATDLADAMNATLHVVYAVRSSRGTEVKGVGGEKWYIDDVSMAESVVRNLANELRPGGNVTTAIVDRDPSTAIVEEAERVGASYLVVGNKRVKGVARVLGAVATDVLRHAPCHVLVAHTT